MWLLVFATACEDKSFSPPFSNSNSVQFSLENISEKNALSRSFSDGDSLLSSGIIPLEAEDRTLYLHSSVTEGIDGSRLGKDESVTRAAPVSDMNTYGSFSVFAAFYQGAWLPGSQNMNFMYYVPVSLSGGVWSPQTDYYWPGSGYKIRFFAYAPIDAEFKPSDQSAAANDFHIKYDVPTDVSKQKDLLVAKSTEYPGNHGNSVSLPFKHVLTAVRFVVGDDMKAGTVNKIRLRNIASAGTYDPETGLGQVSGAVKDFGQELNKVTDGTPGSAITEPFQTFMLPPQSFHDDSSVIEIVFTDDDAEHTLTASLKGQSWVAGTTVTYTISTSSINWNYTLVVAPPADFDYTGGTKPYHVTSYRQNSKGVIEAAGWTARFSTDNGDSWADTPPEWLPAFTASDAGGTTPRAYDVTVSAQIGSDKNNPHTAALQNAPVKGSASSPYNLANQTDGGPIDENTANCYVVNAPGHYSFPLVYGNAIKDGTTNTSAYFSKVSGPSILSRFVSSDSNYSVVDIYSPYIKRHAYCVPAKAELLWQDAPNLVTNIEYNDTADGNISFTVNRDYICQGNAVIVIKAANNSILWSWHIWVTDEDLSKTVEVTNHQNHKYKFMPVNLGWCADRVITYAARSCKVRFIAGNQSQEMTIQQTSKSITLGGGSPYYQWGRKDPFIPSGGGLTNKTWYDPDGSARTESPYWFVGGGIGKQSISSYVSSPQAMSKNDDGDYFYSNLWCANNFFTAEFDPQNDNPVVKTIYDPSPVGFTVPPGNAFTGFTTTGRPASYKPEEVNGFWDNALGGGYNFYTDPSKTKTIFFPAMGHRNYRRSCDIDGGGTWGYFWTANTTYKNDGLDMSLAPWTVYPIHRLNRSYACMVRPAQE